MNHSCRLEFFFSRCLHRSLRQLTQASQANPRVVSLSYARSMATSSGSGDDPTKSTPPLGAAPSSLSGEKPSSSSGHASKGALNRLGLQRSPYLLQHATNPVEWCVVVACEYLSGFIVGTFHIKVNSYNNILCVQHNPAKVT